MGLRQLELDLAPVVELDLGIARSSTVELRLVGRFPIEGSSARFRLRITPKQYGGIATQFPELVFHTLPKSLGIALSSTVGLRHVGKTSAGYHFVLQEVHWNCPE